MRNAAIVTVGTELAEGLRFDTNGPTIARELSTVGYQVRDIVSVADDIEELSAAYQVLCSKFELVVSTGGLGPTCDDVTREAASLALGRPLHEDSRTRERLDRMTGEDADPTRREEQSVQALLLEGATVLDALFGTAPGQDVPTPAGRLLLLPGPPKECMPIFTEWLSRQSSRLRSSIDLSIFGINEMDVQHIVTEIIKDTSGVGFTVLASPSEVHAILTDTGAGPATLATEGEKLRTAFGDLVFSDSRATLAETVIAEATGRGVTLGCAESCTGGLIAGALTDIPGSSAAFLGGIVSYSNDVKMSVLGVSRSSLERYGAVSEEVASEMVQGARARLGCDIAVATTGIAGPDGGSVEKPVGTVWFGLARADGVHTLLRKQNGARAAVRQRSVSTALDLIRRTLLDLPLPDDCDR